MRTIQVYDLVFTLKREWDKETGEPAVFVNEKFPEVRMLQCYNLDDLEDYLGYQLEVFGKDVSGWHDNPEDTFRKGWRLVEVLARLGGRSDHL